MVAAAAATVTVHATRRCRRRRRRRQITMTESSNDEPVLGRRSGLFHRVLMGFKAQSGLKSDKMIFNLCILSK
jgi:hypothetical protein